MIELALFLSTFSVVFALGFQQQNVTGGHYIAAFLTSFWIGGSYLALYRWMPDPTWGQVAAYLGGGPFGIVSSMWIHKRTVGRGPRPRTQLPPKAAPRTPKWMEDR